MRKTIVEDVIEVLIEIRKLHSSQNRFYISSARKRAIEIVAHRGLASKRFSNLNSAVRTIHDACVRRLVGRKGTAYFEGLVVAWFGSGSSELWSHLNSKSRSAQDDFLIKQFFGTSKSHEATIEHSRKVALPQNPQLDEAQTKIDFSKVDLTPYKKLYAKCQAQVQIIIGVQAHYLNKNTTAAEKKHIETTIGAGLWYIKASGIWSGLISRAAIESFHPNSGVSKPKLTSEHHFPRKVAAEELLSKDWDQLDDPAFVLLTDYLEKYGVVNYVTSTENKAVSKFQRSGVFSSPEEAYSRADIRLINVSEDQLKGIKARSLSVIELLLNDSV